MSKSYHFKFRSAIFHVELSSTDEEFIRQEIHYLIDETARLSSEAKLPSGVLEMELYPEPAPQEEAAVSAPVEEAPAAEPKPRQVRGRGAKPKEKTKAKAKAKAGAKSAGKAAATEPAKRKTAKAKAKAEPAAEAEAPAAKGKKTEKAPAEKAATGIDAQAIADLVKVSDKYEMLKEKILSKSNQINRILLGFYFADMAYGGKKGLTTGDVESITEALGNTIKSTNISSQLKKYEDLFTARGERKRGSVVHYSLNKKGKQQFEQLLNA